MGKLNPAKLANFMEIDVYVLIAAPEESLVDSKVRETGRRRRRGKIEERGFSRRIFTDQF